MSNDEGEKVEGPRSFVHILADLADGHAARDCSREFHDLIQSCLRESVSQQNAVKGVFTLKVGVAMGPEGVADVVYEVRHAAPKPRRPKSVFWATEGGNLTAENPKQLPLTGVKQVIDSATGEVKNIGGDAPPKPVV